jgi:putative glutamine amidotransferase
MRPLIGITAKLSLDDHVGVYTNLGSKNQSWSLVACDYIESIEEMGGTPVIIPILENYENIFPLVEKLDGIIFSGGNDVDPKYYKEEREFEYEGLIESLDEFEINLYKKVLADTKIPILGICRGLQLINTVHGGKLYQEMRTGEYPNHTDETETVSKDFIAHKVKIEEESLLYSIVKEKIIETNSFHHQSIKIVGEGLKINAISEDGIIEGIESSDDRFLLAVQWHPEMLANKSSLNDICSRRIFEYFISECERYGLKK